MELKSLINVAGAPNPNKQKQEVTVVGKMLKRSSDDALEPIYDEDLAALQNLTENEVLNVLQKRFEKGEYYSFIGDILLCLNPNEKKNIFGHEVSTSIIMLDRIQ